MEIAILGLGCFWGPEIKFSKIDGVIKTEVGYCGGDTKETSYKEVCTGNTNHAEVVKLDFDPKIISYAKNYKPGSKKLILGNTNIYRDWGWAYEYVGIIYKINSSKINEDFVVGTGKYNSLLNLNLETIL